MAACATQEWIDEVAKKMNTDAEYLKKAKPLTFKWATFLWDCPGGVDRLLDWELKEGMVVTAKVLEEKAPSEWRKGIPRGDYFCVTYSPYETFARMNRKEMTPMVALAQKVYKLDTDMTQLMAKIGPLTAWTDLMATIPSEYPEY